MKTLKQRLEENRILVAPGAYDGLSTRVIDKLNFEAVYVTGYGASASILGWADVGLITQTEMANVVRNVSNRIGGEKFLIADGNTGYGGIINIKRTVNEFEKAGADAIQIEDQVMPKKCGHMLGKQIIPCEEMIEKIKVAVESRTSEDFLIIARTDARSIENISVALQRAKKYAKANADVIFVESPRSVEELKLIRREIEKPIMANMVEGGRTPLLSVKQLQEIGFDLVIYPITALLSAAKAINDSLQILREEGETNQILHKLYSFEKCNDLLGLSEIRELERRYMEDQNNG